MSLTVVNASPSDSSRTAALASAAAQLGGGRLFHLARLPADGLLGRRPDPQVGELLDALRGSSRVVLATPTYRATYSGLLKVVLDQLQEGDLAGTVAVLAATAATPRHYLSLDTGLRPVVATLGAWVAPTVVYATPQQFTPDGRPGREVLARLRAALAEAARIGQAAAR